MKNVNFPESNFKFDKMLVPQGPVLPNVPVNLVSLPVAINESVGDYGRPIVIQTTCWEVSPEELEEINRTGKVWAVVKQAGYIDMTLTGINPFTPQNNG